MQIIRDHITIAELKTMSENMFGGLLKAVVDIEQGIMVVDADMHADEEELLLEAHGSKQEHLWGINIFPDKWGTPEAIVFDSMINIRPSWGNRTRGVEDLSIQKKIKAIVHKFVSI